MDGCEKVQTKADAEGRTVVMIGRVAASAQGARKAGATKFRRKILLQVGLQSMGSRSSDKWGSRALSDTSMGWGVGV